MALKQRGTSPIAWGRWVGITSVSGHGLALGSGSYNNYKHSFSIVLFAVVDAYYKFPYVDVGNGHVSGGGVFKHSTLYSALQTNSLNYLDATTLPGRQLQSRRPMFS